MALSSQLSCQTNAVGLRDREPDGICLYHRFRISNTNQWLALIARWRSSLRYAIQHTTVKAPSMQLVKLPSSQLISRMAGLDPSACCLCRLEHEGQSKRLRAKGQRRTSRQYGRFDRCWWSALDIASVASKLCSWTPGSLSRGSLVSTSPALQHCLPNLHYFGMMRMFAILLCLVSQSSVVFGIADPWVRPTAPSIDNAHLINGWTPRPTEPPRWGGSLGGMAVHQLFPRADMSTCGYSEKLKALADVH